MDDRINSGVVDNDTHATTSIHSESMIFYPIKSCAGFSVRVWPLSDCDLQIKEVCNTEHAPVSVKVDALQFRPNLVLSGILPNDEDN
jgi:hypothetical protein